MLRHLRRGGFARIFGGSVLSQGLLSATNLLAGLLLVRRVPQAQYGYYVLVNSAVPLLAQLQFAFINPLLASRITVADAAGKRNFVGGLLLDQRKFLLGIACLSLVACGLLWLSGAVRGEVALIFALGALASVAWLFREFFRAILVAYRRPYDVLRGDAVFAAILIGGIFLATLTGTPAAIAVLSLVTAAVVGGWLLSRALWRHDPWNVNAPAGVLAQSIRLGAWAATGAVIHWLFSQGYTFIVAARLDAAAVASIAATRLLLSPVGVVSLGIATMMYSSSKLWLTNHGPRGLMRRVLLFALGMSVITITYVGVMWVLRDWIFLNVLKKDYPQRDLLLAIWSLIFLCTIIRDQVIFLLIAHERWKLLAGLTLFCAALGLSVSFVALPRYGAAGGLVGLLAGEVAHVVGVMLLTVRDMRNEGDAHAAAGATP